MHLSIDVIREILCCFCVFTIARWRFVVHGGMDGFSHLVVYLTVAGNNRASKILQSFITAVEQYGLPHHRQKRPQSVVNKCYSNYQLNVLLYHMSHIN